jgi:hypothetical protein
MVAVAFSTARDLFWRPTPVEAIKDKEEGIGIA